MTPEKNKSFLSNDSNKHIYYATNFSTSMELEHWNRDNSHWDATGRGQNIVIVEISLTETAELENSDTPSSPHKETTLIFVTFYIVPVELIIN